MRETTVASRPEGPWARPRVIPFSTPDSEDVSPDQPEAESTDALKERISELEAALESRVVIEQAKGMLAARHMLDVHGAFDALRRAARSNHLGLRELAVRVIAEPATPDEVLAELEG